MKVIKANINNKLVEVEVSETVFEQYKQMEMEEQRQIWRNKKHNESSLDVMTEAGYQVADSNADTINIVIEKESTTSLHKALKTLPLEQHNLIYRVYLLNEKPQDIAKEYGVTRQAIENRITKILKKIQKVLI